MNGRGFPRQMTKYYSMNRRWAWLLLVLLIPAGWWLYHRLMPQSRIVFVSRRSGHCEIYSMNADGGDVKQLTWPSTDPGQAPVSDLAIPAISPDGNLIAYIVDNPDQSELWVMDADGQRKHRIPVQHVPMAGVARPTFSADSRQLYFSSGSWQQVEGPYYTFKGGVYRVGLDGQGEQLVSKRETRFLTCSQVGKILVYNSFQPGYTVQIYRAEADGKYEVQLTHSNSNCQCPAISPDGKSIAFASDVSGIFQLFLMDAHGGNLRQLTHEAFSVGSPSFSPDGQQIAYDVRNLHLTDICTIHLDGRGRKALTHNIDSIVLRKLLYRLGPLADRLHLESSGCDCWPAWGPIPRR